MKAEKRVTGLMRTPRLRLGLLGIGLLAMVQAGCVRAVPQAMSRNPDASWVAPQPSKPASAEVPEAAKPRVLETYGRLPLHFEANRGQTDARVKFLSRGSGYSLFLTSTEAVLVLSKPQVKQSAVSHQPAAKPERTAENNTTVLRMQLLSANPTPEVGGMEELPGKSHYFLGNDPKKWHTNVPAYAKVQYQDVYPGINLIYYGNQRQLEYDFVVAPGADPRAIRLGFQGVERLTLDDEGNLILHTAGGEVVQRAPIMYQKINGVKQTIPGQYVFKGKDKVSFQVAAYDASKPLIIDPVLIYSTYLGGTGFEIGFAIAVDAAGNAYVTGQTNSFEQAFPGASNFPTANPIQPTLGGLGGVACGIACPDVFVTKLNASGDALVYSTYLGGSNNDQGFDIAVDPDGNAYVTGITSSPDFPTTVGAFQPIFLSGQDHFVTKLNAAGSALVYSTFLGGGFCCRGGIAVDSSGNAYVTGQTASPDFPTTAGAFQPAPGGAPGVEDAFVMKLNPAGNAPVYSTYIGGSSIDRGRSIAVDSSGNAYVTGLTLSTDFPTTVGAFQPALRGFMDPFVTKLNAAGSALVYSTYLGGSTGEDFTIGFLPDEGRGIAVDSSGNAYVTGNTTTTDFPTANAMQAAFGGFIDAFVAKLNPAGDGLVYSTYLGGSDRDQAFAIAVDTGGNAYVAGVTRSSNFPTANPLQAALAATQDAFVTKLAPTGSALLFSTYLGGFGLNGEGRIAVDGAGNAYVTGQTASDFFPTTAGSFQPSPAPTGGSDAFVAKIGGFSLTIAIDIKPGSDPNSINLGSEGVIPVAILTTSVADGDLLDFDTVEVDQSSLTLAGSAARVKGKSGNVGSFEDVDGDGDLDLVVQFPTVDLDLTEADTESVLEGQTLDGTPIQGTDSIVVVP